MERSDWRDRGCNTGILYACTAYVARLPRRPLEGVITVIHKYII